MLYIIDIEVFINLFMINILVDHKHYTICLFNGEAFILDSNLERITTLDIQRPTTVVAHNGHRYDFIILEWLNLPPHRLHPDIIVKTLLGCRNDVIFDYSLSLINKEVRSYSSLKNSLYFDTLRVKFMSLKEIAMTEFKIYYDYQPNFDKPVTPSEVPDVLKYNRLDCEVLLKYYNSKRVQNYIQVRQIISSFIYELSGYSINLNNLSDSEIASQYVLSVWKCDPNYGHHVGLWNSGKQLVLLNTINPYRSVDESSLDTLVMEPLRTSSSDQLISMLKRVLLESGSDPVRFKTCLDDQKNKFDFPNLILPGSTALKLKLSLGGLHTVHPSNIAHNLNQRDVVLVEFDFTSYYPSLYSCLANVFRPEFRYITQEKVRSLIAKRGEFKQSKDKLKSDTLKLILNSLFGKSGQSPKGSRIQPLFDPITQLSITINGQLISYKLLYSVLLELEGSECNLAYVNTDAIAFFAPRDQVELLEVLFKANLETINQRLFNVTSSLNFERSLFDVGIIKNSNHLVKIPTMYPTHNSITSGAYKQAIILKGSTFKYSERINNTMSYGAVKIASLNYLIFKTPFEETFDSLIQDGQSQYFFGFISDPHKSFWLGDGLLTERYNYIYPSKAGGLLTQKLGDGQRELIVRLHGLVKGLHRIPAHLPDDLDYTQLSQMSAEAYKKMTNVHYDDGFRVNLDEFNRVKSDLETLGFGIFPSKGKDRNFPGVRSKLHKGESIQQFNEAMSSAWSDEAFDPSTIKGLPPQNLIVLDIDNPSHSTETQQLCEKTKAESNFLCESIDGRFKSIFKLPSFMVGKRYQYKFEGDAPPIEIFQGSDKSIALYGQYKAGTLLTYSLSYPSEFDLIHPLPEFWYSNLEVVPTKSQPNNLSQSYKSVLPLAVHFYNTNHGFEFKFVPEKKLYLSHCPFELHDAGSSTDVYLNSSLDPQCFHNKCRHKYKELEGAFARYNDLNPPCESTSTSSDPDIGNTYKYNELTDQFPYVANAQDPRSFLNNLFPVDDYTNLEGRLNESFESIDIDIREDMGQVFNNLGVNILQAGTGRGKTYTCVREVVKFCNDSHTQGTSNIYLFLCYSLSNVDQIKSYALELKIRSDSLIVLTSETLERDPDILDNLSLGSYIIVCTATLIGYKGASVNMYEAYNKIMSLKSRVQLVVIDEVQRVFDMYKSEITLAVVESTAEGTLSELKSHTLYSKSFDRELRVPTFECPIKRSNIHKYDLDVDEILASFFEPLGEQINYPMYTQLTYKSNSFHSQISTFNAYQSTDESISNLMRRRIEQSPFVTLSENYPLLRSGRGYQTITKPSDYNRLIGTEDEHNIVMKDRVFMKSAQVWGALPLITLLLSSPTSVLMSATITKQTETIIDTMLSSIFDKLTFWKDKAKTKELSQTTVVGVQWDLIKSLSSGKLDINSTLDELGLVLPTERESMSMYNKLTSRNFPVRLLKRNDQWVKFDQITPKRSIGVDYKMSLLSSGGSNGTGENLPHLKTLIINASYHKPLKSVWLAKDKMHHALSLLSERISTLIQNQGRHTRLSHLESEDARRCLVIQMVSSDPGIVKGLMLKKLAQNYDLNANFVTLSLLPDYLVKTLPNINYDLIKRCNDFTANSTQTLDINLPTIEGIKCKNVTLSQLRMFGKDFQTLSKVLSLLRHDQNSINSIKHHYHDVLFKHLYDKFGESLSRRAVEEELGTVCSSSNYSKSFISRIKKLERNSILITRASSYFGTYREFYKEFHLERLDSEIRKKLREILD